MELTAVTRQKLNPDPEFDSIAAISWIINNDVPERNGYKPRTVQGKLHREEWFKSAATIVSVSFLYLGLYVTGDEQHEQWSRSFSRARGDLNLKFFQTEVELIAAFVQTIEKTDPGMVFEITGCLL